MWRVRSTTITIVVLLFAVPAIAQEAGEEREVFFSAGGIEVIGDDESQVSLGAGLFGLRGSDGPDGVFQGEYRHGEKVFFVGPTFGLLGTTEGGLFGYAGLYSDIEFGNWVLTPVVGAGGYHDGGGKDLGGVFQFYVGGDVAYRFTNGSRLGLRLAHISNLGIHDSNPGVEMLLLNYSIPLGTVRGMTRRVTDSFRVRSESPTPLAVR